MSKKTLLQITPNMNLGGVERGTLEIAKAAYLSGYRSIIMSNGGQLLDDLPKDCGVETHLLPVHSKTPTVLVKNAISIKKFIDENNVNIVHVRSRAPAWSVNMIHQHLKKRNCSFITTFHGTYSLGSFPWQQIKKYYNSSMVKSDHIIAVSNFIKDHIQNNYHIADNKITVIKRGVDLSIFNNQNIDQDRVQQLIDLWKIPKNKLIIIMPARFSKWKGHDFLIRSLSLIAEKEFFCLLIGSNHQYSSYEAYLQDEIYKYGLENKVKIVEKINDIQIAYYLSDVVISASTQPEAFGRTVTEAQAMNKICIATNLGGAKENIIDKKTGFLVNTENEMAEAIANIIDMNETQKQSIVSHAQQNVIKYMSLEHMISQTIKLYDNTISQK